MSEPVRRARPRRSVLGCLGAVVVMVLLVAGGAGVGPVLRGQRGSERAGGEGRAPRGDRL